MEIMSRNTKANLLCQSKICKLYRSICMHQYIGAFDISAYEAIVSAEEITESNGRIMQTYPCPTKVMDTIKIMHYLYYFTIISIKF